MKVILDENLPKPLKQVFVGHTVTTVQEQGLSGTLNGELITRIDGAFDVFVTADKNLRYQQNLSGRKIAILELPTNRLPLLRPLFARIAIVTDAISSGEYIELTFEGR